MLLKLKLLVRK